MLNHARDNTSNQMNDDSKVIPYQIQNHPLKGKRIRFKCPHGGLKLNAGLKEAGTVQNCPECGSVFKVPGSAERAAEEWEQEQAARREEERLAREIEERQQAEAEQKRARNEEERRRAEAEEDVMVPLYADPQSVEKPVLPQQLQPYPPKRIQQIEMVAKRYPALETAASLLRTLAGIFSMATALAIFLLWGRTADGWALVFCSAVLLTGVLIAVSLYAASELIKLAIDVEANTRATANRD